MTADAPLDKRSQHIAARKRDVFAALSDDLGLDAYGESAERFYQLLTATVHYEYLADLEALHDAYHALDPDRPGDPAAREAAYQELVAGLDRVLQGANFTEIGSDEMARAGTQAGRVKTPVRTGLEEFRSVRLFSRGSHTEEMVQKSLYGLRKKTIQLHVYDEVVLFAALKLVPPVKKKRVKPIAAPGSVMIKLFQNIAAADLDVVMPGVRVIMSNRDKLMLTVPALVAGIPLLIKLAPAFLVLYGILRFYFGIGPENRGNVGEAIIIAGGIMALGSFFMNQWIKYERRSLRYQLEVNNTVYFHNVTNNVGIFDRIIGVAEDQDCKEALLAYSFLLKADAPMTEAALDEKIEAWVEQRFGLVLDFEVDDALRKLERFGILHRNGSLLSVLPLPAALRELDRRWDGFFQFADVA